MNFFQTLFQTMTQGVDYNLTVSRTQGEMTVIVMPKVNGLKDPGAVHIVPFTMCAAPQELDNAFFGHLSRPLQKSSAVLCNMSQFEKQADEAAANSKSVKAQKDQESKEAKAKKEKYDKFMKAAEEHETAGKLQEALTNLQQARLHGTDKEIKKVDEKIVELKTKLSQGSLFEMEPQPAPATPVAEQSAQRVPAENPQPAPPAQQPMQGVPAQGYYGQPLYGQSGGQNYRQAYPGGNVQGQPYPQNNPYGYPQQGYYQQQPQNPGIPVNDGCYRPEDYAGMPDIEATHVGQVMGM